STVIADGPRTYAQGLAKSIGRGLDLSVDGRRLVLRPVSRALAFPPGQAGLHTTRLEVVYQSEPLQGDKPTRLEYRDAYFGDRIGWKEIVLRASGGARVESASVPSKTISDEL